MNTPDLENLYPEHREWPAGLEHLRQSSSLAALVWNALQLGLLVARLCLENELNQRALVTTHWPDCPQCNRAMRSKGFRPRQMETLIDRPHQNLQIFHNSVAPCTL